MLNDLKKLFSVKEKPYTNVVVGSPIFPCGRSWIDNCLMELGSMWTFCGAHVPYEHIWEPVGKRWRYKWIDTPLGFDLMYPGLMRKDGNTFDSNIRARGVHGFYYEAYDAWKGVFMIRDFREALFSSYIRQGTNSTFEEFINWRDSSTLLPLPEYIALHTMAWLSRSNIMCVRFEDYKQDPRGTLEAICDHIGINRSPARLTSALMNSSHAAMKRCEEDNRTRMWGGGGSVFVGDGVVNRKDSASEDIKCVFKDIENRVGFYLKELGYKVDQVSTVGFSPLIIDFLCSFKNYGEVIGSFNPRALPIDQNAKNFSSSIEEDRRGLKVLLSTLYAVDKQNNLPEGFLEPNLYGWRDGPTREVAINTLKNFGVTI